MDLSLSAALADLSAMPPILSTSPIRWQTPAPPIADSCSKIFLRELSQAHHIVLQLFHFRDELQSLFDFFFTERSSQSL